MVKPGKFSDNNGRTYPHRLAKSESMAKQTINVDPNCDDDYDAASLSCDEALRQILARVETVSDTEILPVREALGRVLARPVVSPLDVPSHRNSAMDGYAVRTADLPADGVARLRVVGHAFAGNPYTGSVGENETVRIMTGAVVPAETNVVVMQEQVETDGDCIVIDNRHVDGQNVRAAGEDIRAGVTVLEPGRVISPADLGLIASLGIGEAEVYRRVRVAFLSTGDELRGVGESLAVGEIYDSNRYTLYGMLTRLGIEIIDLGVVIDEREQARGMATLLHPFLQERFFAGFFYWRYYANLDDVSQEGIWGFSPHAKLAANVLEDIFRARWVVDPSLPSWRSR